MMRNALLAIAVAVAFVCHGATAFSGEYGQHYYSLTDGIKAGSLRDPGLAIIARTTYSYSSKWYDSDGDGSYFKREIFFVEPEVSWTSESPVLFGARYEGRIAMPVAYHVEDMPAKDDTENRTHFTNKIGDLRITPLSLGWEFCKFDLTAGYTLFAATGDFNYNPVTAPEISRPNAGKGYWTHMLNLGGTYYFDEARTWTASVMGHYEVHQRQKDTHVRFGQNLHFEFGVAKEFCSGFRIGLIGYASFQTTDNKVRDDTPAEYQYLDGGSGNRVVALGAEVGYYARNARFPWFATVRGAAELDAKGVMRGYRGVCDLGLRF